MPAFKFRAELVQKMDTHFYGKTSYKNVYEHVVACEFDKREKEDISPSYVSLRIPLLSGTSSFSNTISLPLKLQAGDYELFIKADPGSLESDGESWFHFTFDILSSSYEVNVQFDDNGKITDCYMEQWTHGEDVFDNKEADFYYGRDDIEILDSTDINY